MSTRVRAMTREDGSALRAVFDGLSPASRTSRFHGPVGVLTDAQACRMLDLDGWWHAAFLAEAGPRGRRLPVGIARFVRDADGTAEVALEVVDEWQGRGVGRRLIRRLVQHAWATRVGELHGDVLVGNDAALRLLSQELPGSRVTVVGSTWRVRGDLAAGPLTLDDVLADLSVPALTPCSMPS